MRILYVVHKYDYGQPERGFCYEHFNFYESLVAMGHDVVYFDFPTLARQLGRRGMNRRLLDVVRLERPDLMFTVAWGNDLDHATVRKISQETDTVTLNWFCDDHWKFNGFSRYWAPCFNAVVTTAQCTLGRYDRMGYRNVIKSQWACNHLRYHKLGLPLQHDVTFVGMPHGIRRSAVATLRDAGIRVGVWGAGWPSGRLSQAQMIQVFNQSRIVLNFSEHSGVADPRGRWGRLAHRYLERPLNRLPGGWRAAAVSRSVASKLERSSGGVPDAPAQIKGRVFEAAGCGGFVLTGDAENLGDYYQVGKEMVVFQNMDDLVDKIRYYLSHDSEREAIALAGHDRTRRHHTYEHRFREIFKTMGLPETGRADDAGSVAGLSHRPAVSIAA